MTTLNEMAKDILYIVEEREARGYLNFEITTTGKCNFSCKYCFERSCGMPTGERKDLNEHGRDLAIGTLEQEIRAAKEIMKDPWFDERFKGIQFDFWGGEPTLNMLPINKVVNEFHKHPNTTFFIYTNGSNAPDLAHLATRMSKLGILDRFDVQISYDGNPIHDSYRVRGGGKATSKEVMFAAETIKALGMKVHFKSTLPIDRVLDLPSVWKDFERLNERLGDDDFRYHPTIDYYNSSEYNHGESLSEFKRAMYQVALLEKDFYEKHGHHLMSWFGGGSRKDMCGAGRSMICTDEHGKSYMCHGCMYVENQDQKKKTYFGDIGSPETIYNFKRTHELLDSYRKAEDTESKCQACVATLCMRCNASKLDTSSKTGIMEAWHDYDNQEHMCDYFKEFGIIDRALQRALDKEE